MSFKALTPEEVQSLAKRFRDYTLWSAVSSKAKVWFINPHSFSFSYGDIYNDEGYDRRFETIDVFDVSGVVEAEPNPDNPQYEEAIRYGSGEYGYEFTNRVNDDIQEAGNSDDFFFQDTWLIDTPPIIPVLYVEVKD